MRVHKLCVASAVLLAWTGDASAADSSWHAEGAAVVYAESCAGQPCHEAERVEVSCQGNRRLDIWMGVEAEAARPNASMVVTIEIDGQRFRLRGLTDEGGLFGYTPTVVVPSASALPEALMHGQRFRVFFDGGATPVFSGHLQGTRQVFNRQLSRCLKASKGTP